MTAIQAAFQLTFTASSRSRSMVACADRSTSWLCRVDHPRREVGMAAGSGTGSRVVHSSCAVALAAGAADAEPIMKPLGGAAAVASRAGAGSGAPTTSASTGAAGATLCGWWITKPSSSEADDGASARVTGAKPRSRGACSAAGSRPRSWTANVRSSSGTSAGGPSPRPADVSVDKVWSPSEFDRVIVRSLLFASGKDRVANWFPLVVVRPGRERIPGRPQVRPSTSRGAAPA